MEPMSMNLKILLPYQVFADLRGIKRIVTESYQGSFGLLPHRLDCTAALAPGILIYETDAGKEVYLAIDEGILSKAGPDVFVSVRNAFEGKELGYLHEAVKQEFRNIDEHEKDVRAVMTQLEIGLIRRFEELRKK